MTKMLQTLEIHKKCMKLEDNIFEISMKYGIEEAIDVLSFLLDETEYYKQNDLQL